MNAKLRAEPDWWTAAQTLIDSCCLLPTPEARVQWLQQSCLALGDALYPAFLRVLCLVGEHGQAAAQQAVASTLSLAIASGRLPSGGQAAWGATPSLAPTRQQGPIEFLCAWYLRPADADRLSARGFDQSLRALLGLVAHDAAAHALYRSRLAAAADDPLEGAWSRADRQALQALAVAWAPGAAPGTAADAFLQAARAAPATQGLAAVGASGWLGLRPR